MKAAIIGGGNIGLALTEGLIRAGVCKSEDITITRRNPASLEAYTKKGFLTGTDNAVAVKVVAVPLEITVPSPRSSPGLYTVPLTGLLVNPALLLITTRYSSAAGVDGVNEPSIDTSVIPVNDRAVGCAVGAAQGVEAVAVTFKLSMLIFGLDPVVPPVPL